MNNSREFHSIPLIFINAKDCKLFYRSIIHERMVNARIIITDWFANRKIHFNHIWCTFFLFLKIYNIIYANWMQKLTNIFSQENPLNDQSYVRENQAKFKHPVFLRILRPETLVRHDHEWENIQQNYNKTFNGCKLKDLPIV